MIYTICTLDYWYFISQIWYCYRTFDYWKQINEHNRWDWEEEIVATLFWFSCKLFTIGKSQHDSMKVISSSGCPVIKIQGYAMIIFINIRDHPTFMGEGE